MDWMDNMLGAAAVGMRRAGSYMNDAMIAAGGAIVDGAIAVGKTAIGVAGATINFAGNILSRAANAGKQCAYNMATDPMGTLANVAGINPAMNIGNMALAGLSIGNNKGVAIYEIDDPDMQQRDISSIEWNPQVTLIAEQLGITKAGAPDPWIDAENKEGSNGTPSQEAIEKYKKEKAFLSSVDKETFNKQFEKMLNSDIPCAYLVDCERPDSMAKQELAGKNIIIPEGVDEN